MRTLPMVVFLVLASCSAHYRPLVKPPAAGAPDLFFRNVRVFTARGPEVLEGRDVWVSEGRIRSVSPTGTAPPPEGAQLVEGEGATLLPGLVDTHVHVTTTATPPWAFRMPNPEHNLEAWLYAGVTTVADMGGQPGNIDPLIEKLAAGKLAGPRVVRGYGPVTAPGSHPVPAAKSMLPWPLGAIVVASLLQPESANDARKVVADAKSSGATWLKLIVDELPPGSPRMGREMLCTLVDAAHGAGLRAFVHVGSNDDALLAVRCGADHLAHGIYKEPISEALVGELKARNVSVTFTASGFEGTRVLSLGGWTPTPLQRAVGSEEDELVPAAGEAGKAFAANDTLGPFARAIAPTEILRANVKRLHDAGILLLAGSDSPIVGILPGASLHEELAFFEDAGIPPAEVLLTATRRAARFVDPNATWGVVEEGRPADLLIVSGDPTVSVRALGQIRHVVKDGRLIERLP